MTGAMAETTMALSVGSWDALVLGVLALAVAMGLARLWLGPRAGDRVVAADVLSVIATAGIVLLALVLDNPLYLDVALIYGVLAFVGVVALARAIGGGDR